MLRLPAWLWGGDLSAFAAAAGWLIEPLATGDRWRVRLAERALSPLPRRLRVNRLPGRANAGNPAAYTRLRTLASLAHLVDVLDSQAIAGELERLRRTHPNDVGAWLAQVSLALTGASQHEPESVAQTVLTQWLLPTLPRAELHLLEVDPVLSFRGAELRALL